MKRTILLLFIIAISLFGQQINFDISLTYSQNDPAMRTKLDEFTKKLKAALVAYDWEFPIQDFEAIESSIYINLKEEYSSLNFSGMMTISSGIKQSGNIKLIQKRDIFFKENTLNMRIGYNDDPDLNSPDISSLENILKFYTYCLLIENFDRLSYTDNENFYLYGEKYVKKAVALAARASGIDAVKAWENRKKTIDEYQNGNKNEERKLNALIFNAKYFINKFEPERAGFFAKYIMSTLEQMNKESRTTIFNSSSAELAAIFRQEPDKSYLAKLKQMDPEHAKNYDK